MTLKDDILKADDCSLTPVEVPEWGLTVYVKKMSLAGMENVQAVVNKASSGKDGKTGVAEMVAKIVYDEAGERIFEDSDAEAIGNKSHTALTRIANAFNDANGLSEEAVVEAGKA